MSTACDECRRLFEGKQPPDLKFWASLRTWRLEEAALLASGLDPLSLPHGGVEAHLDHSVEWDDIRRTLLLLRRARLPSGLVKVVGPDEFIAWAGVTGVTVPRELRAAVNEYQNAWNAAFTQQEGSDRRGRRPEADQREKNTLLKIIAGMAIRGYGYDPGASRSSVAKEIVDDIHSAGLKIDDDTVRKWLRQAVDVVERSSEN